MEAFIPLVDHALCPLYNSIINQSANDKDKITTVLMYMLFIWRKTYDFDGGQSILKAIERGGP
jgi:hypothetical protein